jgi:predicted extracellular nuclease
MRRRSSLLLVMSLVASTLPFLALTPAIADSDAAVVISQVYGGGGNSGAIYTHDFVELYNRSDVPVSLAGMSIQYASATGDGNLGANASQLTELPAVTLQPGQYLLVQQSGGTTGEPLPTPDVVDGTPINMSATAGKVALVDGATTLGCNGGSAPCSAEQLARIIDLVGYGGANFYEGSGAAPTLSNTTAALRLGDGAQDTDDNAADFVAGAPAPRNSTHEPDPGPGDGTPVTISQVYGGGGNSNATYTHDFIELYNRSDAPVSLDGWSVQYASAAGSSWQVTALGGTLQPDTHYLIQQAAGAGGTTPLPTPDATGSTAMAATNGKVALASSTTALSGTCPVGSASVVDFVGFGSTANCFEGSGPTPTLSNTTAALRLEDGARDTDDNAADFEVGSPAPRNTGDGGGEDPDPVELCEVDEDDLTPINEIQGDGDATPLGGQAVITRGVVTADFTSGGQSGIPSNQGLRGFFIEGIAVDRDADPQTSEGVFVFDGGGVFDGQIGDLVHVAGTAGEFSGVTQVSANDLAVCADTGVDTELPPPVELPLPADPFDRGELFEPYESMRVTHSELTVVEFFQLERFGEVRLSSGGVLDNPTNVVDPRDDEAYQEIFLFNRANTIILDDGRTGQNLDRLGEDVDPLPYVEPGDTLRVGDQLRDHAAILHFGFGEWRLQPIDIDAITQEFQDNRTRPRPESPPKVGGTMTVASFNVLNYFNGDGYFVGDDPVSAAGFPTSRGAVTPSEFERQTAKIVDAIVRMDADVVGLIEIENDEGERQAAAALVDAINTTAGDDLYDFVDTGVVGTDAIKTAYIYKPSTVEATGDYAILDSSVDPRFDDQRSRPVIAQTFTELASGEAVTVAVNHLKSKGSACADEDNDPRQGNCNGVRLRAAEAMAEWLATDPTGEEAVGNLIIGDLNAYAKEDPIVALQEAGYRDLLDRFAPEGSTPYTYTFDATQGYLDHALADDDLDPHVIGAAAWNINADEVPALDYLESCCGVSGNQRFRTEAIAEAYYQPDAFRSSDHDPVLVGLDLRGPDCAGLPGRADRNPWCDGDERADPAPGRPGRP